MASNGKVVSPADTPKSYIVETDSGTVRRNHQHLTVIPERTDIPAEQDQTRKGTMNKSHPRPEHR